MVIYTPEQIREREAACVWAHMVDDRYLQRLRPKSVRFGAFECAFLSNVHLSHRPRKSRKRRQTRTHKVARDEAIRRRELALKADEDSAKWC